jgi:peptidoglycan hydrolase-like protein with peptidoglycan-binding domain
MSWAIVASIVSLFTTFLPLIPQITQLWKSSAGFPAIASAITSSPAAADLAAVGAVLFPGADKSIQAVLAAIHLGVPEATKWVQSALNAAQKIGFINMGPDLVVDGKFGPKTFAAVVLLQAKLGVHATGAVATSEYAALNLILAGKVPAVGAPA